VRSCWAEMRLRSARTDRVVMLLVMRVALIDYSPTLPARLISVSSISSVVDIARAEAW
jgi:hypothetical protein